MIDTGFGEAVDIARVARQGERNIGQFAAKFERLRAAGEQFGKLAAGAAAAEIEVGKKQAMEPLFSVNSVEVQLEDSKNCLRCFHEHSSQRITWLAIDLRIE